MDSLWSEQGPVFPTHMEYVGTMYAWVTMFFPNFPPLGLPIQIWSREQMIDFLLAHGVEVHPIAINAEFIFAYLRNHYFYPRVYPPELFIHLPGSPFHGESYLPNRYDFFVPNPQVLTDGRPEWIELYCPNYPNEDNLDPAEWTPAQKTDFLSAWGIAGYNGDNVENWKDEQIGLFIDLHDNAYPKDVPPLLIERGEKDVQEKLETSVTVLQQSIKKLARSYNLAGQDSTSWFMSMPSSYKLPKPDVATSKLSFMAAQFGHEYYHGTE